MSGTTELSSNTPESAAEPTAEPQQPEPEQQPQPAAEPTAEPQQPEPKTSSSAATPLATPPPADEERSAPSESPGRQRAGSADESSYNDEFTDEESPAKPQPQQPQQAEDDEQSAERRHSSSDVSPHRAAPSSQSASRRRKAHKNLPVATISYPSRDPDLTVADFLDPSRPLVKSTLPLTKPKAPSFVDDATADQRRLLRAEHKVQSAIRSASLNSQRQNERRYLKAQYEFEREKKLAERAIYHRERTVLWSQRLGASPLAVDLVADNERIEEEAYVREREERRRRVLAERKKRRIKNEIIVKALAEVPLLEEARRQKREMIEEERREKALRDVQRVEAIQHRKQEDMASLQRERQAKLDQRTMVHEPPHSNSRRR